MAANPSRTIPSRCLQIRACVWHFPLSDTAQPQVSAWGKLAQLPLKCCFAGRPEQGRNSVLQAMLMNSFRAQDTWKSGLEVVAFLGTSLAARTNLVDLQENPMHPPGFCHSWLGSSS